MDFTTATEKEINGTSHQDTIIATEAELTAVFGEPNRERTNRTTTDWRLRFEDGTIATIYDYFHANSRGDCQEWSIGGSGRASAERVRDTLREAVDGIA